MSNIRFERCLKPANAVGDPSLEIFRDGPDSAYGVYAYVSGALDSNVCILNWPLPIEAFQDRYEQTMINKYSNEHNHVKNPNWQEANQHDQ